MADFSAIQSILGPSGSTASSAPSMAKLSLSKMLEKGFTDTDTNIDSAGAAGVGVLQGIADISDIKSQGALNMRNLEADFGLKSDISARGFEQRTSQSEQAFQTTTDFEADKFAFAKEQSDAQFDQATNDDGSPAQ